MKTKQPVAPGPWRNIGVHPALHEELHIQAIRERANLRRKLHRILCEALDRPDLYLQDEPTRTPSR